MRRRSFGLMAGMPLTIIGFPAFVEIAKAQKADALLLRSTLIPLGNERGRNAAKTFAGSAWGC
jgi:hypothetical protein